MPLVDLLRLAELSLTGQSNPQLSEDLLRAVVEATSSRAGILRRGREVIARWPRTLSEQAEGESEGWTEISFGNGDPGWVLRLLKAERVEESVMAAAMLGFRAWDLREELKRTRFDERIHLWELEAIRSIATSIGGILEPERLAEELISHLVALIGVRSAHLYLGSDPATAETVGGFGVPPLDAEQLERAWHQGIYSEELVALPLESDQGTLGVLVAAEKEARAGTEPLAANDVRQLELFAVQVTVAMEFARLTRESLERERLRRELEVAAEIQKHLYPQQFPDFEGYRLAARSSPSRQVAGDTYDVMLDDSQLVATVADVSGKGVGAGMIASGIHAAVRLIVGAGSGLDGLALQLNMYLAGATEDNRFATFALVRLASDGAFTAVNAGHLPVLIRRRGGEVERIESSGLPLGIMAGASYTEVSGRLQPGDLVMLYTDGLTEAEDAEEEEFGVDRVEELVAALDEPDAEATCVELLRAVEEFTQGRPLQDDATLLVVERIVDDRG